MKILVEEDALKEIFYMLVRSTALSNKVDVVQMTKLVKQATYLLADLLEETPNENIS